jgi:hypothetical protein
MNETLTWFYIKSADFRIPGIKIEMRAIDVPSPINIAMHPFRVVMVASNELSYYDKVGSEWIEYERAQIDEFYSVESGFHGPKTIMEVA